MTASNEDKPRRKPVFGPVSLTCTKTRKRALTVVQVASRDIFERKWMNKFMSLEDEYEFPPATSQDLSEEETTLGILVEHLYKTVEYIHFCAREAKQLGLQFPCSTEKLKENPRIIARSAIGTMEAQRFLVQDILKGFQANKNGELINGKFRWQDLSLPLRRKINNLFDVVEREERNGDWVIDERTTKACEDLIQMGYKSMLKKEGSGWV